MKVRGWLLGFAILAAITNTNAQKGVDNGTRYGTGEDSIRCLTNISLFVPYAKVKNYADAYKPWKAAYDECPAATKDLYLYGVQIVNWQIENEKDPAKRDALIEDLMAVYDKRIKYFGNDKKYGKDWITARKAQDYIRLKEKDPKFDPTVVYGWMAPIIEEYKDQTEALGVSLYMFASFKMLEKNPDHKTKYVQDFLKCSSILDSQLKAAKAANNEKELPNLQAYKTGVDNGFANSGAADCATLENIYSTQIEENKSNLNFLKEAVSLFRRVGCQESESYFVASGYAHQIEPTMESAFGLGRQSLKKKDFDAAEKYFTEAASLATEDSTKSDIYYTLALVAYDRNSYSRARQFCQKAIEANPRACKAYILIGTMYAATAGSVYDDPVMRKCVFYAAVDKFEAARRADSSCAGEASSLIARYSSHFPTTEEVFMHPELGKGKRITIGGWIGESTTIR